MATGGLTQVDPSDEFAIHPVAGICEATDLLRYRMFGGHRGTSRDAVPLTRWVYGSPGSWLIDTVDDGF